MTEAVRPVISSLAGPVLSFCRSTLSCRRRSNFFLQFLSPLLAHIMCCGFWTGTDFADVQLKVSAEGAETVVLLYAAGGPFPASYKTTGVFCISSAIRPVFRARYATALHACAVFLKCFLQGKHELAS